jgi:hypothetical protein
VFITKEGLASPSSRLQSKTPNCKPTHRRKRSLCIRIWRDPNALLPQRVEIDLVEGRTVARSVDAVLGSPVRTLTTDALRGKFEMCWRATPGLPLDQGAALWNGVSALETLEDVRVVAALISPSRSRQDGKHGREPAL